MNLLKNEINIKKQSSEIFVDLIFQQGRWILLRAEVFHGITACVTHLYVLNCKEQATGPELRVASNT
jgi:hypothetical protein